MQGKMGATDHLVLGQSGAARDLLDALDAARGHFVLESGHHGDLWLDLEMLFVDARRMQRWALSLAARACTCEPDFVCGPLTGGAFIAQLLAAEIGAGFAFAERGGSETVGLHYRIPAAVRKAVLGKRVLIVDDVVNAGSALSFTLRDLQSCGAEPAGFAALLTLGGAAADIARLHRVPLFALASLDSRLWLPEACPLCRSRMPLINRVSRPRPTTNRQDLEMSKG